MDYENILKAMDILIDKKLEKNARYDQTVLVTVVDDSERLSGKYTVKSDIAKFTAIKQANDTNLYSKGNKLYVMIPQGDYTNDKIILGKALISDTATDLIYRKPIEQLYNLIPENHMSIGGNGNYILSYNNKNVNIGQWRDTEPKACSAFFDTFGFEVTIQTKGTLPEDQIDYGIKFQITYTDGSNDTLFLKSQRDMIGNVYRYILPYEQSVIFQNSSGKCIASINAEAYWNALDGSTVITEQNWTISFSNLKFYNGFYLATTDRDFITAYSIGDKYYRSALDKKEIILLWLKFNPETHTPIKVDVLPDNMFITWKTSILPIVLNNGNDSNNYWLTLFDKTQTMSQLVPMTVNSNITQIQILVENSLQTQQTLILEYINYFSHHDLDKAKKIYFKFSDGLNGYYQLYNQQHQLSNPGDASLIRTIRPVLEDNAIIADDAYVSWLYAINSAGKDPVCMFNVQKEINTGSPLLEFIISQTYIENLNNTIACTIISNGELYYGSVDLKFGIPVWLEKPCTLEVTGMVPFSTASGRRACDLPSMKNINSIRLYARIYDQDSPRNNQTFRVLKDIEWELVNPVNGYMKLLPESKISYRQSCDGTLIPVENPDKSSFYCDLIAYVDYLNGATSDSYIKVTATWPKNTEEDQQIITYVPITYCNAANYASLIGPDYINWESSEKPFEKTEYFLRDTFYRQDVKPTLRFGIRQTGYSIENDNELHIESTATPPSENTVQTLGLIANSLWRQPILIFKNRKLIGESKVNFSSFSNNDKKSLEEKINDLQRQIDELKEGL